MSTQEAAYQIGFPQAIAEETIECGGQERSLKDTARDLRAAHEEIEQYRKSALRLAAELDELQAVAEAEDNAELARTTRQLKKSALAVTERIEDR